MTSRPDVYRAPSWSWVSVDGPLAYDVPIFEPDKYDLCLYRCDFISCQIEPKSANNPFGEVLAGSLKLKCVLRQAWFNPSDTSILWVHKDDETSGAIEAHCWDDFRRSRSKQPEHDESTDQDKRFKGYHDETGDWPPMQVFCLPIISVHDDTVWAGLLLVKSEKETFKRVGFFENAPKEYFDHLPQHEITII